jgi:hypothetical protein
LAPPLAHSYTQTRKQENFDIRIKSQAIQNLRYENKGKIKASPLIADLAELVSPGSST